MRIFNFIKRCFRRAGYIALSCIAICGVTYGAAQAESGRQTDEHATEDPIEIHPECYVERLVSIGSLYGRNGRFVGFRINRGIDPTRFAALVARGLAPGALLLQIDGMPITNSDQYEYVHRKFEELNCGGTINVLVEQHNETIELELTLN
jgi:hypothetical protein